MKQIALVLIAIVLAGCGGYKRRDVTNIHISTPFPFSDLHISYLQTQLTIEISEKGKDIKDLSIKEHSYQLSDSQGNLFPLILSRQSSFDGRSSFEERMGTIANRAFYFTVQNPRYSKPDLGVLPEGTYNLTFDVLNDSLVTPVKVNFDLKDRWHKVPKMYQ